MKRIVIDYEKCPYCKSEDIYYTCKTGSNSNKDNHHFCNSCKTKWVDYVSKTERIKIK